MTLRDDEHLAAGNEQRFGFVILVRWICRVERFDRRRLGIGRCGFLHAIQDDVIPLVPPPLPVSAM
jgi:hypothetical protein